jgi:CBS domain containing-hemolysin-like protein
MVITNTALITSVVHDRLGPNWAFLTPLILVPATLILGEILPKTIFRRYADRAVLWLVRPLLTIRTAFLPLVKLSTGVARLLQLLAGDGKKAGEPFVTREEILLLLRSGKESGLKPAESKMIHKIFNFSDTTVREAMVPLVDICAVREDATVREVTEVVTKERFSRIPVFKEEMVNLTGVIHSFDLLSEKNPETPVRHLIRPLLYVPEQQSLDQLLLSMQQRGVSVAAVVDEYGGTTGIVTMEDVLEEVVGEIEDEYDSKEQLYWKLSDTMYLFSGRMEVDVINEMFPWNLPKEGYETLGGLVMHQSGKIPRTGEEVALPNLTLRVARGDTRSVKEVLVILKSPMEKAPS